jgi:pantothenate kinase type III
MPVSSAMKKRGGGGKAKTAGHSKKQNPQLCVPKWPDALPAFRGTQFVFSLSCGNTRLSWARINKNLLRPELMWTTRPPPEDTNSPNLFEFLPEDLQREISTPLPPKSNPITNRVLCSLLLQRRLSVITVYLISPNANHERRALRLFEGLPAVIYKLSQKDFLHHASVPGLSAYPTMGIDRLAALMGAIQRFPHRYSHLVIDGGTTLTYTTISKATNRVGGGITIGPQKKLIAMSDLTVEGALPDLHEEELNDMFEQLKDAKTTLNTFCTTNTEQTMVGSVLMETTIHLSHVIQKWRESLPDEIPKEQTPVVLLCGGEGMLLSMLLGPDHANLLETSPEVQEFLASGEIIETSEQWHNGPAAAKAFQMVHHGPAIHDGVQNILVSQHVAAGAETPINILRGELVGQRIIVNSSSKPGTIVSVHRAADVARDDMCEDTFCVFINDDDSFVEVNFKQVVGTFYTARWKSSLLLTFGRRKQKDWLSFRSVVKFFMTNQSSLLGR